MREIKLREWDDDNHTMVYDWYKITEEKHVKGRFLGRQAQTLATEVMQFTGLKDKTGKEIYEGDILEIENRTHHNYEVYWDSTNGRWGLKRICAVIEKPSWSQLKVIGNIYENPELLKVKN